MEDRESHGEEMISQCANAGVPILENVLCFPLQSQPGWASAISDLILQSAELKGLVCHSNSPRVSMDILRGYQ